jgi:hypothetical protein
MRFSMRNIAGSALVAMLLCLTQPIHAQDDAQKTATQQNLQRQLTAVYALTKPTNDLSDIVTPGAVLDLQKDNLLMCAINNPIPEDNTYKKGKIGQNLGKSFLKGFGNSMLTNQSAFNIVRRTFVTGEKFWVIRISVVDDGIIFRVYSDPYAGVRYWGDLKFPFKGSLPSADDVMKTLAEVVTAEPMESAAQSAAAPAPAAPAAQQTEAALAPIAPPPPPPDAPPAPPKTIALGQTKDQVAGILGQPQKVANLGVKEIDYYSDMKVVFLKGKVSDIQ